MRLASGLLLFVASGLAHAGDTSATDTVARLYRDFAWEAVLAPNDAPGLAQQPKAVLLRYFTPKLAAALQADAACTARTHEICRLGFLPLWDSQDPVAQDLTITPAGPGWVQVRYSGPSDAAPVVLKLKLVSGKSGSRIADIEYSSGLSLAELLAGEAQGSPSSPPAGGGR